MRMLDGGTLKSNESLEACIKIQKNVRKSIIFPTAILEAFFFPYRFRIVLLKLYIQGSLFSTRDNKLS